jgi:hypothetical protein
MAETIANLEFFIFSPPSFGPADTWRMSDFLSIFPLLTKTREPDRIFGEPQTIPVLGTRANAVPLS